jgi:carbon-monoxide dehydrogenase large subunit
MQPMKFGVGQSVRRVEDAALVKGEGRFIADLVPRDALRLVMVRSPHGHAAFDFGNLDRVRAMPGVRLVLTAEDITHLGDLPCRGIPRNRDGEAMVPVPRPVLARRVARHVGDPVAAVVANSEDQARDAADALEISFTPRSVVTEAAAALVEGAPLVHPERGSNLAFDALVGDQDATEAAFARAARVVRLDLVNNRLVANYIETRGAIARWDEATRRFALAVGSQGVHGIRDNLCEYVFRLPRESMQVTTPDVGGGFGPKIFLYAEYALALEAARGTGRTVAWIGGRREHFQGDSQGRDNVSTAELALDLDHRFLALRVDTLANLGAYAAQYGPMIPNTGATMLPGTYRLPALSARIRGVYTNTVPTDAYRGAGRPEALYLLERLVDVAAREVGIPPERMREINFVTPSEMPYRTASGRTYDSGNFAAHLSRALVAADRAGFAARRSGSEARGMLRGFGFASYVECCAFGAEDVTVRLESDGRVTVLIGTQSNGQGHKTAYAQIVAEQLDIDPDLVEVVQGDSDRIPSGAGTGGSRSIPVGGVSVSRATEDLAAKLKALAAQILDVPTERLDFANGRLVAAGTNHTLSLTDLAARADEATRTGSGRFKQPEATYPNGTHVCEVEIDPATGVVRPQNYVVVDDVGVTLNPMLLAGQIHGGVAQGIGQALLERTVYSEDGQLATSSLQDYALPRADTTVMIGFETLNVPSITNPLGLKGAGEAGTIGACPAVMNAVVDALNHARGLRHIDMPATPERVWRAIRASGPA